jgi:hypothetical protein
MQKHEERIGVRIPGQGYHMVTALVGALESDEEVLARISKVVGTVFNVSGTKYELLSSSPYRLKRLPNEDEEGEAEAPKKEPPKKEPRVKAEKPPKPPKPPEEEKKIALPQVGERWKPRDPRRIAAFTVVSIADDHVVTDDGRKIQLARFPRYERVL